MKNPSYTDLISVQRLEMHYVLAENSHSMNAAVVNKCEAEFLKIVEEVSKKLGIELVVELTPIGEGGLRLPYDLLAIPRDVKLNILYLLAGGFITYFVTQIPNIGGDSEETEIKKAAIIQYAYEEAVKSGYAAKFKEEYEKAVKNIEERKRAQKIFDSIDLDSMLETQEATYVNEPAENNNQNLISNTFVYDEQQEEAIQKLVELSEEREINRAKSNFYKNLYKYDKVESLEFISKTPDGESLSKSITVNRGDFMRFMIDTDSIPDEIDTEAEIQIISPVIVKGKFTWKGWYNGKKIDFYMGHDDFREKLYKNEIIIKSGSSIKCELHTRMKEDELGHTRITSYGVAIVHSYTEGNQTIEIVRKKKDKSKPFDTNQIPLFEEDEDNTSL